MPQLVRGVALVVVTAMVLPLSSPGMLAARQKPKADDSRLAALKKEAATEVEKAHTSTQQMVDSVFSFAELGFQETESSRYLTGILERNGFAIKRGIAGIPTAWLATWGSGKPIISLGSDIDGIPRASQKPGVAYHDPMIEGGPGHGEGHNSGLPVLITAAIAVKKIMEREKLPGTIQMWPGVAEELLGTKAYYVREGLFRDVDACIFAHVDNTLRTAVGSSSGTGLVSVEYTFKGETAHSAGAPWRGRSALDAVELMNVGWNFRREHLRLQHRSHYVIRDGGDQPNVVPRTASVWYYFRETTYPGITSLWELGDNVARGAALMTSTELLPTRVLGSAWPIHYNKPIAEAMDANIRTVGLPAWSPEDQQLAKALQRELKVEQKGLRTELEALQAPVSDDENRGGGSDDIGDVSWTVPTVTLRYPSNIPELPGHNWSNAIAMATPIAHKGATAGAKVAALTILDLLMKPELLKVARDYFDTVQTKDVKYRPLIRPQDKPAIELNADTMARFGPALQKLQYDPTRFKTYLDQLGIKYPTVRQQ